MDDDLAAPIIGSSRLRSLAAKIRDRCREGDFLDWLIYRAQQVQRIDTLQHRRRVEWDIDCNSHPGRSRRRCPPRLNEMTFAEIEALDTVDAEAVCAAVAVCVHDVMREHQPLFTGDDSPARWVFPVPQATEAAKKINWLFTRFDGRLQVGAAALTDKQREVLNVLLDAPVAMTKEALGDATGCPAESARMAISAIRGAFGGRHAVSVASRSPTTYFLSPKMKAFISHNLG